jgi:hypothetical protein
MDANPKVADAVDPVHAQMEPVPVPTYYSDPTFSCQF